MEKLKISIVTPNYNYAKYIGETIESIIAQNYQNYEYIIVDDGSTDNSVEVINKYVAQFPNNIFLIRQENRGQTPAINVGMKQVTGDVVCWINSDDTFCESVFQKVAERFTEDKRTDIVFGDMNVTDLHGNFIYRRRHLNFNYITGCLLGFTTVLSSNAVFWKKEAMIKNGYFNESLKCNMDGDFYSRLTKGMRVKRLNSAVANFRKQAFSKAAEHNENWDLVVKNETSFERKNAYLNLLISKIIPYKYSAIIKLPFHFIRVSLRIIRLHFIKQKKEIKQYNKKKKFINAS